MSPTGPVGRPAIAWTVILLTAAAVIALHAVVEVEPVEEDGLDLMVLRLQGQYILGTRQLVGDDERILAQTAALNTGSVAQRQAYIALQAELANPEAAAATLSELDELIRRERDSDADFALTSREQRTQEALEALLLPADGLARDEYVTRVAGLEDEHRAALVEELGWFGRLLLTPAGVDEAERKRLLAESWRVTLVVVAGFGTLAILGVLGLAGLVVLGVLIAKGSVGSGLGTSATPHGIYAETFAVWLVAFLLLQLAAGLLAALAPGLSLLFSACGFLASLGALAWPRLRGVPFASVRADIGLIPGRGLFEPLVGVGGYLLALPLLGCGILLTLVLVLIDGALAAEASTFTSATPPAHPIVGELAGSGWGVRLQVLFLAAIVAPIVEETMFRGVLYRHLREATARLGVGWSVIVSGGFNGLLFAAIHPQGWVAIPALMSLAFAFVLLREWRGTLLPSMIVHGISNGLVMLLLIAVLEA